MGFIDTEADEIDFNQTMSDLYPYTLYTYKVRLRSATANETQLDKLWSPFATKKARTKAAIPQKPPVMTMGSFEVVSHDIQKRSVYVYWRQIPIFERNGPNFRYTVTEVMEGSLKRLVSYDVCLYITTSGGGGNGVWKFGRVIWTILELL